MSKRRKDEEEGTQTGAKRDKRSLYEILGIDATDGAEDLKKPVKRLALRLRPDKNEDDYATEKFNTLKAVFDILSNDEKRCKYDQSGISGLPPSKLDALFLEKILADQEGGQAEGGEDDEETVKFLESLFKAPEVTTGAENTTAKAEEAVPEKHESSLQLVDTDEAAEDEDTKEEEAADEQKEKEKEKKEKGKEQEKEKERDRDRDSNRDNKRRRGGEDRRRREDPVPGPHDDPYAVESFSRFLISNTVMGPVMGQGGVTVSEFQATSGAQIGVSRHKELFPGTNDRIIVLRGTIPRMLEALRLITHKVAEQEFGEHNDQVRVLVPNQCAGAITGHGGCIIRAIVQESGANISLAPQGQLLAGVTERVVTMKGPLEHQFRAVELMLEKLVIDMKYAMLAEGRVALGNAGPAAERYERHDRYERNDRRDRSERFDRYEERYDDRYDRRERYDRHDRGYDRYDNYRERDDRYEDPYDERYGPPANPYNAGGYRSTRYAQPLSYKSPPPPVRPGPPPRFAPVSYRDSGPPQYVALSGIGGPVFGSPYIPTEIPSAASMMTYEPPMGYTVVGGPGQVGGGAGFLTGNNGHIISTAQYLPAEGGAGGMPGGRQLAPPSQLEANIGAIFNDPNHKYSVTVPLSDEHIAALMSKSGRSVLDIQKAASVHISLSERGDFAEGTTNRKLTIAGTNEAVRNAQQMITMKVIEVLEGPK
eukprot:TRINITY_DN38473_c0_g1_i1.p1 TRINITY_DN38473_c0_g1~~TRINITY_DN38473_c0_g1_i1.p1  ORF type:complete len:708 (-),score=167.49 TRINITY_DN38473_c0_g1_i1:1039-3162(-)